MYVYYLYMYVHIINNPSIYYISIKLELLLKIWFHKYKMEIYV